GPERRRGGRPAVRRRALLGPGDHRPLPEGRVRDLPGSLRAHEPWIGSGRRGGAEDRSRRGAAQGLVPAAPRADPSSSPGGRFAGDVVAKPLVSRGRKRLPGPVRRPEDPLASVAGARRQDRPRAPVVLSRPPVAPEYARSSGLGGFPDPAGPRRSL